MKHVKSNFDIALIRKDLEKLTDKEFKTKYPEINRESVDGLSDSELEKMAGGFTDGPIRKW